MSIATDCACGIRHNANEHMEPTGDMMMKKNRLRPIISGNACFFVFRILDLLRCF